MHARHTLLMRILIMLGVFGLSGGLYLAPVPASSAHEPDDDDAVVEDEEHLPVAFASGRFSVTIPGGGDVSFAVSDQGTVTDLVVVPGTDLAGGEPIFANDGFRIVFTDANGAMRVLEVEVAVDREDGRFEIEVEAELEDEDEAEDDGDLDDVDEDRRGPNRGPGAGDDHADRSGPGSGGDED